MEEFAETKTVPIELQKPPVFTEEEAQAVLQVQSDIAASHVDASGNQVDYWKIVGVTYDRTVVAVDQPSDEGSGVRFCVRVGTAAQLIQGTPLAEQRMHDNGPKGLSFRGTGMGLDTEFGHISEAPRILPTIDEKLLFPISEEGQPFSPAAKAAAEATAKREAEAPLAVQSGQISVGGIRKFLRRRG